MLLLIDTIRHHAADDEESVHATAGTRRASDAEQHGEKDVDGSEEQFHVDPVMSPVVPSPQVLPTLPPLPSACNSMLSSSKPSCLAALLSSPEWSSVLQRIRPVSDAVWLDESDCVAACRSALHHCGARVREQHLRSVLNEHLPRLVECISVVAALSARHGSAESSRFTSMKQRRARLVRRRLTTWRWMMRNLTNERGPWSQQQIITADGRKTEETNETQSKKKVYWKLDESENNSRMRLKLKINYQGHDHHTSAHDYVPPSNMRRTPSGVDLSGADNESDSSSSHPSSLSSSVASGPPSLLSSASGNGSDDLFQAAILFAKSGVLAHQLDNATLNRPSSVADETEETEDWDQVESQQKAAAAAGGAAGKEKEALPALIAEQSVFETECELIHFSGNVGGRLLVTTTHLYFEAREDGANEKRRGGSKRRHRLAADSQSLSRDQSWLLSDIVAMHYRRYQLRRNSVELFFEDHTCVFFKFASESQRNHVHTKLLRVIRPYVRIRQSRLAASVGSGTSSGCVTALAPMGFLYAGSAGNYGIGGPWGGLSTDLLRRTALTEAWRTRKMSTFDYLMHLNTLAGRSYNDLSQYFVMPWVIADWTSSSIDLNDVNNETGVFRDLTKPIGALNPDRLNVFIDRYNSIDETMGMPKFMYGTHYSNAGTVLHYLIRLEPYTTAAVELQDGKFDHSDRLFHSLPATWDGVMTNPADVKELIPEFFYLPSMFQNLSGLELGTKQRGEKIDDVILPPWANSAEELVRIHRAALESEYVSMNMHHWIDLIFGYKQTGQAAVDAHNVFFHLTYEGAVDLDSIDDPTLRSSLEAQVEHFGQTPAQLFTQPHPQRCKKSEHAESTIPSLFNQLREMQRLQNDASDTDCQVDSSALSLLQLQLYTVDQVTGSASSENPLLFCALLPGSDRLLTLGLDRIMMIHKFKNVIQEYIPPFVLDIDRRQSGSSGSAVLTPGTMVAGSSGSGSMSSVGGGLASAFSFMGGSKSHPSSGQRIGVHFTVGLNILPFFFLVSHDDRFLLSCGHWDGSVRVTHIDSGHNIQSLAHHKDIVTCMAMSEVGDFIVTGSKDTTVGVWQVADAVVDMASHPTYAAMPNGAAAAAATVAAAASGSLYLLNQPMHVLYGHDDEVTCVSVRSDLDVVLSGSRDGTIMLHSLRSGRYTRTITPPDGGAIRWAELSSQGTIVSYSLADLMLHTYDINGVWLASCDTGERLYCIRFSKDGEFILAGGERKQMTIYQTHAPLHAVYRLPPTDATIRSCCLTREEQHVLIGTSSGRLYVYSLNAEFLKKRFLKRLVHLGL